MAMFRVAALGVITFAEVAAHMPVVSALQQSAPKPGHGKRNASSWKFGQDPAKNASQAYDDLSDEITDFQAQLQTMHRLHLKELATKRLYGENLLDEQLKAATMENSSNAKIEALVESLDHHVLLLRSRAVEIQGHIAIMRTQFDDVIANLSSATEFANTALDGVKNRASDTEVSVLSELTEMRRAAAAHAAKTKFWRMLVKEHGLQNSRSKTAPKVSVLRGRGLSRENATPSAPLALLQTHPGGASTASQRTAHMKSKNAKKEHGGRARNTSAVDHVASGLGDLKGEVGDLSTLHESQMHEIEGDIEDRFNQGAQAIAQLLKDQQDLNITHGKLLTLAPRLLEAVRQLAETRAYFTRQFKALRIFLWGVGNQTSIIDAVESVPRRQAASRAASKTARHLSLIQSEAEAVPKRREVADRIKEAETEADAAFRNLLGHSNGFESDLNRKRTAADAELLAEQKRLQDKLLEKTKENVRMAHVNNNMVEDLRHMNRDNRKLEKQARFFDNQIQLLGEDVSAAKASLVVGKAFVEDTLRRVSESSINNSNVLDELEAEDRVVMRNTQHEEALAAISNAWANLGVAKEDDLDGSVSLLATGTVYAGHPDGARQNKAAAKKKAPAAAKKKAPTGKMESKKRPAKQSQDDQDDQEEENSLLMPDRESKETLDDDEGEEDDEASSLTLTTIEDIMTSMKSNLRKLSHAQASTKGELAAKFEDAYGACSRSGVSLDKEQKVLRSRVVWVESLNQRLQGAVKKLKGHEETLAGSSKSLRTYIGNLGRDAVGVDTVAEESIGSLSLLQMSSRVVRRSSAPLTDGDDGAEQPEQTSAELGSETFRHVAFRASALQQTLQDMEIQSKERLRTHKAEYARRLTDMADANKKLSSSVQEIQGGNQAIVANNMRLRTRARELMQDCKTLNDDLTFLEGNLSTAVDFLDTTLKTVASKKTPELDVLKELDEGDRRFSEQRDKQRRLGEISSSLEARTQTSLIQMTAAETPQALLRGLEGGLGDLRNEYESLEADAKAKFREEAKQKREEHARLLTVKETKLQENRALQALQDRLKAAVASLEANRGQLEERSRSLRTFAQRLSTRKEPNLLTRPHAKPQEEERAEASGDLAGEETPQAVRAVHSLLQAKDPLSGGSAPAAAAGKLLSWFTR